VSFAETLLKKLEEEQVRQAHAALAQPQGRDDFEYGRMCGLYAGIGHARQVLTQLISEDADRNDGL
jgi:hypothetical protein